MKKRFPLAKGTMLQSRYRILRQLGCGGMGAVYEATDARFKNRLVALKETYADSDDTRRAFKREAQLLAKTEHEAFPRVMDYFSEGDGYFLVMELIRGKDLADLLKEKIEPFEQEQILEWADQILDALEDLHCNRIIHRDIKPSNLKLTPKGRLKLLDFGIAKGFCDNDVTKFTTFGSLAAATLQYAPLEQILKANIDWFSALSVNYPEKTAAILQRSTDEPSDLYALSATLYQLLTNQLPVNAPTRALALWAGLSDKMLPAHEINPRISPSLSAFLQKGLELDRKDRFHSAREMREALQKIALPSPDKSIFAQDEVEESIALENAYLVSPFENDQREVILNNQNLTFGGNVQEVDLQPSKKRFVVDVSDEVKVDEIQVFYNDLVEIPQDEIILSNAKNQDLITEIETKIPFEEKVSAIPVDKIGAFSTPREQNLSTAGLGKRLLINTKNIDSGFEPKPLFQYQISNNKFQKTLGALMSICLITILSAVLGMATFQQPAEIPISAGDIKETAISNSIIPTQILPISTRQKKYSTPSKDLSAAKRKINSSNQKTIELPREKIETQDFQPPAKRTIEDVKQPRQVINEQKRKLKPSQNSDCIFNGKC